MFIEVGISLRISYLASSSESSFVGVDMASDFGRNCCLFGVALAAPGATVAEAEAMESLPAAVEDWEVLLWLLPLPLTLWYTGIFSLKMSSQ